MNSIATSSFKRFTLNEGLEIVPSIIVTVEDSRQYGYPEEPTEIDIEGYKGFIDRVSGKSIYVKAVDPKVYLKIESKYLGNSLRNAIQALGLKSNIVGEFPDINQDFYMVREHPWDAFIRLSKYLPEGYYMACLGNYIKIFKTPGDGDFKELSIANYATDANYNRYNEGRVASISQNSENGNPNYCGLYSVPISKMMHTDIVKSSGNDLINNYIGRYLNRNSYYPENLLFQSTSGVYEVGDGIIINDIKLMIVSKSVSLGVGGTGGGAYRCIRVG